MEEKKTTSEKQLKAVAHARKFKREAKKYNSEYAQMAMRQIASGAKLADVAYWFGTSLANLNKWKKENPEFKRALNQGAKLTQAWLLAKGMQFSVEHQVIDKITTYKVNKEGEIVGDKTVKEFKKTIPGNPQMIMFLAGALGRRLGDDTWSSKQFIESKIEKNVTHRIIDGKAIAEKMDKLAGKWAIPLENVTITEAEFESPQLPEKCGDAGETVEVDTEKPC